MEPSRTPNLWLIFAWILVSADGVWGILHCQVARQICLDDGACALLLDVIAKTCGDTFDGTVCRSSSLETCQGALTSVWTNPPFSGSCVCSDQRHDADCRHLRDSLATHPCLKIPRIDPADRLTTEDYPTCTYALNLCYHNIKCKRIYEYFRRTCRIKDSQCATRDRTKCHKAWTKMQLTPIYGCLCHGDADIEKCAKVYTLINANPCVHTTDTVELSTASQIHYDPEGRPSVSVLDYDSNATDSAEIGAFNPVVSALHGELVGVYGVHGHPNIIGGSVDEPLPRHPPTPPDVVPSTSIKAKSTCPKAHDTCVDDFSCRVLLDNMLQVCDTMRAPCNRTECMAAVRDFYHLGNPTTTRSVAFCICKYNDPACLIQQRQLHPPCAQRPEVEVPACHQVAALCRANPDCRVRMERFISACAVDQTTIQCRGPLEECRLALIDVLGTPLRTNCACSGNDFSLLYSCIDWQRLVWLNPCVVQAQKEYHEMKMTTPPPIPPKPSPRPYNNEANRAQMHSKPINKATSSTRTNNDQHPTAAQLVPTDTSINTETCVVTSGGANTVQIPVKERQRIYHVDNPDCSMLCSCNVGAYVDCHHLGCPDKINCHSGSQAVYLHSFTTYRAFRGYCTCYSGNFICAKPADGYKLNPGVYLFLGYSKQEETSVKNFTNLTVSNSVYSLQKLLETGETLCRLLISHQIDENVIVQVYLEEFVTERMNNSITPEMVGKEDKVCRPLLQNITRMINNRDPIVHNDVALSVLKIATVEVLTDQTFSGTSTTLKKSDMCLLVVAMGLGILLVHRPP